MAGDASRRSTAWSSKKRPFQTSSWVSIAIHELHHERRKRAGIFEAIERGDVWMIERREHVRFSPEPGEAFRVAPQRLGKNLQSDITTELGVAAAVYLSHAALSDDGDDFVRPEARARRERHREGMLPAESGGGKEAVQNSEVWSAGAYSSEWPVRLEINPATGQRASSWCSGRRPGS